MLKYGSILFLLFLSGLVCQGDEKQRCSEWGTTTEITTFQGLYCPLLAPEIPVLAPAKKKTIEPFNLDETAVSPETAIKVTSSDGKEYSYYYSDVIRYRLVGNPPSWQPVKVRARIWIPCTKSPDDFQQGMVGIQKSDTATVRFRSKVIENNVPADSKPSLSPVQLK